MILGNSNYEFSVRSQCDEHRLKYTPMDRDV